MDEPRQWPKGFVYTSKPHELTLSKEVIDHFLSGVEVDGVEQTPLIVKKGGVHPNLVLEKITPHLKYKGKHPHPLSGSPYSDRCQYGVFAKDSIPKGVILGEYASERQLIHHETRIAFKDSEHAWTPPFFTMRGVCLYEQAS